MARNLVDSMLHKVTKNDGGRKIRVLFGKILRKIRDRISQKRLKSHDYGMVGFVKQLVDELGMDMITSPERGSRIPFRNCKFLKMEIFPGLVFIVKNPDLEIHKM